MSIGVMAETTVSSDQVVLRRVLLLLDVASYSDALLRSAAELAGYCQAELVGVLVEESGLRQAAVLSFCEEIVLTSSQERPLGVAQMARSLRAFATQTEQGVQRVARRVGVRWRFEAYPGAGREWWLSQLNEGEVAAIGHRRHGLWHCGSHQRRLHLREEAVYLCYDATPAAERAMRLALLLAQREGRALGVFLPSQSRSAAEQQRLLQSLHAEGVSGFVRIYPGDSMSQLLQRLSLLSSGALVLPASLPLLHQPPRFQSLSASLSAPLLIVA